jgi:hypothetical protein
MTSVVTASVTSGLHSTVTKTYTMTDAEWDRIVAAYQSDANVSINGVATYNQVLLYMFNTVLIATLTAKTKAFESANAIAALPPPTPINPT